MAKRGRAVSIDRLVRQLNQLDSKREKLKAAIRTALNALLDDARGDGVSAAPKAVDRPADATQPTRRRRPKMSAAGRKAISDAQKRRWAKQKGATH